MSKAKLQMIDGPDGRKLACRHTATRSGVSFVWLAGFNSDMEGTKVVELEAWARAAGHGFTAFDYSGHGQSSGDFRDGTVATWLADTLTVIDEIAKGPQILVGSSMGGWMALLAARERAERVAGLVLIAPAPDFVDKLMWPSIPGHGRIEITQNGVWMQPSDYGEPVAITRGLIESGRAHNVMDGPIAFDGPVRILQGMQDPDVPWRHARGLVELMTSEDIAITLVKDGDHRLSRPQDIARLKAVCAEIAAV